MSQGSQGGAEEEPGGPDFRVVSTMATLGAFRSTSPLRITIIIITISRQ